MNCVLTILVRTGCFDWSEIPGASESENEQVDLLIREVIAASAASGVSQEGNTYYEYSKAVMQKSMGRPKYCVYIVRWALCNYFSQVWISKEQLCEIYSIRSEKRLLLMWIRFRRASDLLAQKLKAGVTPKRLLKNRGISNTTAQRLRLFEKLKML